MTPYVGLHPWYGPGGHPECPPAGQIAIGRKHNYRCYPEEDGFVAEERPEGGAWIRLSAGHETAYGAGLACAIAERDHTAQERPAPPELSQPSPPSEAPATSAPPRKPTALEALKARAASKKQVRES